MLEKNNVYAYLAVALNLAFLVIISTCLTCLFLPEQVMIYGTERILYQFVFFITLDYLIYAVIFIILFYRYNISLLKRSATIGIGSIAVFIFFTYAAASIIPFTDSTYIIKLLILFFGGFILPYSHRKIRSFFIL